MSRWEDWGLRPLHVTRRENLKIYLVNWIKSVSEQLLQQTKIHWLASCPIRSGPLHRCKMHSDAATMVPSTVLDHACTASNGTNCKCYWPSDYT